MFDKLKEVSHYIGYAIAIVINSSRIWSFLNVLIVLVRGVVPLLLVYLVKHLIDVVGKLSGVAQSKDVLFELYFTIGWVGVFFLLNSLSSILSQLFRERQSHYVNDYIQQIIHDKTERIPFAYFEDSSYQDVFYRALEEAPYRPTSIFYGLLGVLQNMITISLLGLVLFGLGLKLILFVVVAAIPIVLFRIKFSRKLYDLKKEQTEEERRVFYFNHLLTAKEYAKELRIFNLGPTFRELFENKRDALREKQWRLVKQKSYWEMAVQMISVSALIVVFGYIVSETFNGILSIGEMAMYFLIFQRGYAVLQELLKGVNNLYEDNLFLKNFIEFQKIPVDTDAKGNWVFPSKIQKAIRFDNVSFKYPHSNKWILKNVNLTIPVGKNIAIVGANGSGKTTMVKLLTGLYRPQKGAVFVDDVNLITISPDDLAKNVSVIFQDFTLYNVSARDNIWYGNVTLNKDDDKVKNAAQQAGIDDLFSNLSNGYDTTLGVLFKDSEQLSQGEWQRTALARSFFNQGQVIILDEPTSSLDAFTEVSLIKHFKEITKEKTAVIISHRLSTIQMADLVVVLKNGGIAEIGEPDELLAQKGIYYEMVKSLR